jgi:dihydroorotate dehydrogenase electron transfer subunit
MCLDDRIAPTFEPVTVLRNDRIAAGVFKLRLHAPEIAASIQGGQFIHLRIDAQATLLRRPLSVCQVVGDELIILYAVVGEGTRLLTEKPIGDTSMDALGPIGSYWPLSVDGDSVKAPLLVGGGLGIAPLGMLGHTFRNKGIKATIVQGSQNEARLITRSDHAGIERDIRYATDDGTFGYHGFVTDLVAQAIKEQDFDVCYICGPEPMQRAVSELTCAHDILSYVSFERRMACGIGACLGCMVPTNDGLKRVCVDGPVFDAREVFWDDAISSRLH